MNYQEENIELMFSDGIRREADFLLQKVYGGMNNQSDLVAAAKESPYTDSGVFILSELERAGYVNRNKENRKLFGLSEKGKVYIKKIQEMPKKEVIVVPFFDPFKGRKNEIKPGKLERELAAV